MGLLDNIKNILTIPEDDEFEDDIEETVDVKPEPKKVQYDTSKKSESYPRIIGAKNKTVPQSDSQMQVVLVKPERYDDVTSIADHINDKKTVVLNLENTDRDLSRRIVDFISGATYANHGNLRKISKGTMLIVPYGVDMMGELFIDDYEEGKMYF